MSSACAHSHTHTHTTGQSAHTYAALCTMVLLLLLHCNRFSGIITLRGGKGATFSMTTSGNGYLCICVWDRGCASGISQCNELYDIGLKAANVFVILLQACVCRNKKNNIQRKESGYMGQQTKAYGIPPLTMHRRMVGLTTQPLRCIYS